MNVFVMIKIVTKILINKINIRNTISTIVTLLVLLISIYSFNFDFITIPKIFTFNLASNFLIFSFLVTFFIYSSTLLNVPDYIVKGVILAPLSEKTCYKLYIIHSIISNIFSLAPLYCVVSIKNILSFGIINFIYKLIIFILFLIFASIANKLRKLIMNKKIYSNKNIFFCIKILIFILIIITAYLMCCTTNNKQVIFYSLLQKIIEDCLFIISGGIIETSMFYLTALKIFSLIIAEILIINIILVKTNLSASIFYQNRQEDINLREHNLSYCWWNKVLSKLLLILKIHPVHKIFLLKEIKQILREKRVLIKTLSFSSFMIIILIICVNKMNNSSRLDGLSTIFIIICNYFSLITSIFAFAREKKGWWLIKITNYNTSRIFYIKFIVYFLLSIIIGIVSYLILNIIFFILYNKYLFIDSIYRCLITLFIFIPVNINLGFLLGSIISFNYNPFDSTAESSFASLNSTMLCCAVLTSFPNIIVCLSDPHSFFTVIKYLASLGYLLIISIITKNVFNTKLKYLV